MKKKVVSAVVSVLAALSASSASAAIITYTATGFATGSSVLGNFSENIVVTSVADTATLQSCVQGGMPVAGCNVVINSSLTVDVANVGQFSLTNPTYTFVNNAAGIFGFGEVNLALPIGIRTLMFLNLPTQQFTQVGDFLSYDLVSNLGPISTHSLVTSTFVPQFNGFLPVDTSGGPVNLFASPFVASTFQAVVSGGNAVPEPASWALLIAGFGLVGSAMRNRTRKATVSFS
jgi:hypothetical protein